MPWFFKRDSETMVVMAPSTFIMRRRYLMVKRVMRRAHSFPLSKRERIDLILKLTR
jgi:hypothetical protein